jgi:hypothetical protein
LLFGVQAADAQRPADEWLIIRTPTQAYGLDDQPIRPAEPSIDPDLMPAWNALISVPSNDVRILREVHDRGVSIEFGDLPSGVNGRYGNEEVMINRVLAGEDARALAALLSHELTHAVQREKGPPPETNSCLADEVQAFGVESEVWGFLWSGRPPSGTRLERQLTGLYRIWVAEGEAGLNRLVAGAPGYQDLCESIPPLLP